MTKQSKIFAGLLAGAALGAVVALIISEDNNEMKDKIGDFLCDLTKSSKDKIAGLTDLVKETVAKVTA